MQLLEQIHVPIKADADARQYQHLEVVFGIILKVENQLSQDEAFCSWTDSGLMLGPERHWSGMATARFS
jgi:hypothetical protein